MKALAVFLAGLLATAAGVLFALQGAGIVRWPAESFMIDARDWIEYGIVIAMIGVGLLFAARRIGKRAS